MQNYFEIANLDMAAGVRILVTPSSGLRARGGLDQLETTHQQTAHRAGAVDHWTAATHLQIPDLFQVSHPAKCWKGRNTKIE